MFNLIPFTLNNDNADPSNSWVFSNAPDRLAWFSLNLGLTPLLLRTKRVHDRSILCDMFAASDDKNKKYHGDNTKPLSKHMFYEPVRMLAELVPIPVNQQYFFLYTAFSGKVDAAFRALLEADDERAMWLLGYWFGLLCRFDHIWWLSTRVRRDYRTVCIWLDKRKVRRRAGGEGVMWRQLMVDLEGATQPPVELGNLFIF